jgi:hypothetical protein
MVDRVCALVGRAPRARYADLRGQIRQRTTADEHGADTARFQHLLDGENFHFLDAALRQAHTVTTSRSGEGFRGEASR